MVAESEVFQYEPYKCFSLNKYSSLSNNSLGLKILHINEKDYIIAPDEKNIKFFSFDNYLGEKTFYDKNIACFNA